MAEFPQWLNFDILSNIISHVLVEKDTPRDTFEDPDDRPTLAHRGRTAGFSDLLSMAKSCRTLSAPCLQALWQNQTSLLPILRLIPQFELDSDFRNGWVLGEDISPSDWARFDYHAGMVKEVHLPLDGSGVPITSMWNNTENVHPSVFSYLFYSRSGPFFPNLSVISTVADLRLPMFHSPALNRAELHLESNSLADTKSSPWASSFINRLHMSPYLDAVSLRHITVNLSTLRTLFSIPRLRSLEICVTSSFFNGELDDLIDTSSTNLRSLRSLSINCPREFRDVELPSPPSISASTWRLVLPQLHSLSFSGPTDYMAFICEIIECQTLRRCILSVLHNKKISLAAQGALHERIGLQLGVLSSGNLEALSIYMNNEYLVPFKPMRLNHFSPLYELHNLSKLVFSTLPFIPTDSDLRTMGQSWPLLKTLIIPLSRYTPKPKTTLRGVNMLAELCPHLEQMSLTFDATNPWSVPDPEDQKWVSKRSQPSLKVLHVNYSMLHPDCVEPTSNWLKNLFPNLRNLEYDSHDYDSDDMRPLFGSIAIGREKPLWARVRENLSS